MTTTSTCIQGDSLAWMRNTKNQFADMIIADPPFNIGFEYDSYDDKKDVGDYLDWCTLWLKEAMRIMKPTGNMLVCMGDEHVSDIDYICRNNLKFKRVNWLIWHYKFGQSGKLDTRKKFTRSKTHILRFVKSDKCYFNAKAVAVPSDRQKLYNDKRADPRGKCPDDIFTFKRIAGTHHERIKGIKTQMPVELLETWIKAMCKPGGLVFDPFPGSGASLVAAKKLKRHAIGIEISTNYTAAILNRLAKV